MAEMRLEVLLEVERTGMSVAEVCRRYGISRQTYYRYRRRYLAEGLEGLEDRSRRPLEPANQIADAHTRRIPSWRSRALISGVVSVFAVLMIVPITPADAYCTSGITRWSGSSYTLHVAPVIAGWNQTSVTNANAQWDNGNIAYSTLNYNTPLYNQGLAYAYQASFANFSQIGFPNNAPGVTTLSSGTTHASAWMRFNTTFTWNTSGTMSSSLKKADVHTIAMHEMGHASGLNHPAVCGTMTSAEIASAMNPQWIKKWTVNSDDKAGIALRY